MNRRQFLTTTGATVAGSLLVNPVQSGIPFIAPSAKKRVALVGTGIRGITFWGKSVVENYSDIIEYVGICDINPGRLEFAKNYMGVNCPTFTNFDEMLAKTKPEMVIVTTVDATHHEFIIKALDQGIEVLTEKPMTTDETKCKAILDAEKRSGKKLIVGFNYRWGTLFSKYKELLVSQDIGKITSVDFHWYLNIYHGASYFRRWHGIKAKGGSLWVHKATHHFDLLNWWLDSDPVEVTAYGALEHYGRNNAFRGANCRNCAYTKQCKFFYDIKGDQMSVNLYTNNEQYDGYVRDNCLWREEIDIYDKMSAQIRYANDVVVNYSLTTYSPFEGHAIAFNGFNGRMDSWEGLPWREKERVSQAELHAKEMNQNLKEDDTAYDEIVKMKNFADYELIKVPKASGGHGGGDKRLHDKIFRNPAAADPYKHAAGSRDGAMSILIGIAARKSIEEKRPVKISELTDLPLLAVRP